MPALLAFTLAGAAIWSLFGLLHAAGWAALIGGAVGNAVIANIAQFGRVALCGLISQYNADRSVPNFDLLPVLLKAR